MGTCIYYYTGTGNSFWVARELAAALEAESPVSISAGTGAQDLTAETIGLVFPVHIWGVPGAVVRFVETLEGPHPAYVFAVAVNAGQVSNTLVQLGEIMRTRGVNLGAGFAITMPSNYIPWGGPGPREEQERRFGLARERIASIVPVIRDRQVVPLEKGPLWQRIVFSAIYRLSFEKVSGMDKGFWADERCNHCGICQKVCPTSNIVLDQGRPVWMHGCQQCFACLQWCPKEAIQYGRKTARYARYHHPEISLKDILQSRGA